MSRLCGCTHGSEQHAAKSTATSKWRGKCGVVECACKRYKWAKEAGKKVQDDVTSPPVES